MKRRRVAHSAEGGASEAPQLTDAEKEELKWVPHIYFAAGALLATIILLIMFGAGAMEPKPAEPEPVPDSQFKVFLDEKYSKSIKGEKLYFKDQGESTSGTDWSQGWQCAGTELAALTDAELAKKGAAAADVEKGIKVQCEDHAKGYAGDADGGFTCCMISKDADGAHTFTVHQGSAVAWTGVAKALVLPAAAFTKDAKTFDLATIPYDTETAYKTGETDKRPPWNNGFKCTGPEFKTLPDVKYDQRKYKGFKSKSRAATNVDFVAKGCYEWCVDSNEKLADLEPKADEKAKTKPTDEERAAARAGTHMTCCQWTPADRKCALVLGAALEWSGTTTSVAMAPGAEFITDAASLDTTAAAKADD